MAVEKFQDSCNKTIIVGIKFDGHARELLNWAVMKAAGPGDRILAINVCRNSGSISDERALLNSCLEEYIGLCKKKQVALSGQVLKGNSIKKVLVREAKNCSASLVIVGITKLSAFGGWTSVAKYCSKRLPETTEVISIYDGKVFFSRLSNLQLLQEPVSCLTEKTTRSIFSESKMSSFDEKARFGITRLAFASESQLKSSTVKGCKKNIGREVGYDEFAKSFSVLTRISRVRHVSMYE